MYELYSKFNSRKLLLNFLELKINMNNVNAINFQADFARQTKELVGKRLPFQTRKVQLAFANHVH